MEETTTPAATGELTFSQEPTVAPSVVEPQAPVIRRGKLDRFGVAMGTGRRKTSVARVRLKAGSGKFEINDRPMEEFFCVERDRILDSGSVTSRPTSWDSVDVWVRVNGGGTTWVKPARLSWASPEPLKR